MAYMNQEKKSKISVAIKPILKKYGLKGTLSVKNHSNILLTVKSGEVDFKSTFLQINPYWFQEHFDGLAKDFLTEAFAALKSADWYDDSDAMTDHFNTAYYFSIKIGTSWDKPYSLIL